jgi:hypothetical protein
MTAKAESESLEREQVQIRTGVLRIEERVPKLEPTIDAHQKRKRSGRNPLRTVAGNHEPPVIPNGVGQESGRLLHHFDFMGHPLDRRQTSRLVPVDWHIGCSRATPRDHQHSQYRTANRRTPRL